MLNALAIIVALIPNNQIDTTIAARHIDEVVVTGSRATVRAADLPHTVSVVSRHALDEQRQHSLLPTLAAQVPGLFATSRGAMGYGVSGGAAGQLSLRGVGGPAQAGLPTTGLLVLIDGHPQYMGLMGHPIADAYLSTTAERVEVLRGPASVLYGSCAMGGVINIISPQPSADGLHGMANVGYGSFNTAQADAHVSARKGAISGSVGGSFGHTDGHRSNMGFTQYGGHAKVRYAASDRWAAWANANLTRFEASNPGPVAAPLIDNDQKVLRGAVSAAVENRYERTTGAITAFYNFGQHLINNGYTEGQAPQPVRFNSTDRMGGLSVHQNIMLLSDSPFGSRITLGADYFSFGGEAWNQPVNPEMPRIGLVDTLLHEQAGYIALEQQLTPLLTLSAGLRLNNNTVVGHEWVPQVGLAVHLPASIELKLSAGKGFRNPTIRELYMFAQANPNLLPERLWSYEVALEQHLLDGRLQYGLNLYHIDGNNLILNSIVDGRPLNINSGRIKNSGGEVQVSYLITSGLRADAHYSYLHMEHPVLASPEHMAYLGISYSHKRWSASTSLQHIAGLHTTLAANAPTEQFTLWSLRAQYRLTKWLSLWARGENLLNQKYEINAGFPMPHASVMGGLGFTF